MGNPIGRSHRRAPCRRCGDGPAFENPSYMPDPLGVQASDEGALKVIHCRGWIALHERIRQTKSNVGKPGFFPGSIKRQGKSVIDDIGGVPRFESCLLQKSYRGAKIAVLQSFEGLLITHSAVPDE